jgi:enoyl-CoA hydratase
VTAPAPGVIEVTRAGGTATVLLSRPEVLNAINVEMLTALRAALEELSADPGIKVVILAGKGRAFSAGVDLKALGGGQVSNGGAGEALDTLARAVTSLLSAMPKVTIARVHGFCYTGALELALACDLMVVAEEARLGDTHAKWGLRPTWGMSQRLLHAVGPVRARELSYTARDFTGAEAAQWQLATRSVPAGQLDQAVAAIAAQVEANSPGSVAAYKDLYGAALDRGLTDGLAYEAATSYEIADTQQRLDAFGKR